MDQVSDITYKADGKRLGDENLHKDFGEFRHYIVEKYSYSLANKYVNKEPLDVSILSLLRTMLMVENTLQTHLT